MALRFRQVEVFRCLMAAGTATRAAAELSISQPAVSRHVAELESHLGFKLFDRVKGRLEPTTSAVHFARVVEQNFLGLARIERAAENIRDEVPQGTQFVETNPRATPSSDPSCIATSLSRPKWSFQNALSSRTTTAPAPASASTCMSTTSPA